MPKVTVITPVYNTREDLLRVCIESVLNQTHEDLQYVLVDNGCDDARGQILREYAQEDSRIELLTFEENVGYSRAMNAGMERADGKYLHFLDSDDYLEPTAYEEWVEAMEETPADMMFLAFNNIYDDDDSKNFTYVFPIDRKVFNPQWYCNSLNIFTLESQVWNKFYLLDFIKRTNNKFFDDIKFVGADAIFSFKNYLSSYKCINFIKALINYRRDIPSGVVKSLGKKECDCIKDIENFFTYCLDLYNNCEMPYVRLRLLENVNLFFYYIAYLLENDKFHNFYIDLLINMFKKIKKADIIDAKIFYDFSSNLFNHIDKLLDRNISRNDPKISIVIPVYTPPIYQLLQCISSTINKSDDVEIILIANGTDFNTFNMLFNTFIENENVTLYKFQNNQGASGAVNKGIEIAKGKYILIVDSDDHIAPHAIQILLNAINDNPDMVVFNCDAFDNNLNLIFPNILFRGNPPIFNKLSAIDDNLELLKFTFQYWNKLYKKSMLVKFNINLDSELKNVLPDVLFVLQTYYFSNYIKVIPDSLYTYNLGMGVFAKYSYENCKYLNEPLIFVKKLHNFIINNKFNSTVKKMYFEFGIFAHIWQFISVSHPKNRLYLFNNFKKFIKENKLKFTYSDLMFKYYLLYLILRYGNVTCFNLLLKILPSYKRINALYHRAKRLLGR